MDGAGERGKYGARAGDGLVVDVDGADDDDDDNDRTHNGGGNCRAADRRRAAERNLPRGGRGGNANARETRNDEVSVIAESVLKKNVRGRGGERAGGRTDGKRGDDRTRRRTTTVAVT